MLFNIFLNYNSIYLSGINILLLLIIQCNYIRAEIKLTILHTNDMHARFEQTNVLSGKCSEADQKSYNCYGGFARLRQAIKMYTWDAEKRGRNVLFLNAGDTFQGTPYYNLFKWTIAAEMTNMLGIHAMVNI